MRYIKISIIILIIMSGFLVVTLYAGNMNTSEDTKMNNDNIEIATFAGGCFWCVESDFEKVSGVIKVISGYTGGHVKSPSYEQVTSGNTGHVEAVQIYYDNSRISYDQLLDIFWKHVNPTDSGGQFVDRGKQYVTAIFVHNDNQKHKALASKKALEDSKIFNSPIVTQILEFKKFYKAEEYHQNYYKKNPVRYKFYRYNSGRDQFLEKIWKHIEKDSNLIFNKKYLKPSDDILKQKLTPIQYKVVRKNATEPPFQNQYWDNNQEGIYVDIVSGEPLFSSLDKFKSGTGWPSFTKPLEPDHIVEKKDSTLFMVRTEVRSKYGDSHLGHVFSDGPKPTGLRYCINSAALNFIPKNKLKQYGYGQYLKLFK